MEALKKILVDSINCDLLRIIISQGRGKDDTGSIKIRPIRQKEKLVFQAASQQGQQVFHKNYEKGELISQILNWMEYHYKQLQMETTERNVHVLVSKKGKITIKEQVHKENVKQGDLSHNRKKHYILQEGIAVPFLIDLGVMTKEGKVIRQNYGKFRQINRFLEFIADIVPQLRRDKELTIIDFGCGKSYLTFAMYYYLKVLQGLDIRVIGLDLKEDVIRHCNDLAGQYGYEKLKFLTGDIAAYEGVSKVDMVVTLHACDTATDYALEKAVKWGARVILSVPCCQHELNGQIHNQTLEPILKYGLIKERLAALVTDALRAGLLEEKGYQVQILEFIDMEHTPKNILIRAVHTGKQVNNSQITSCMELLGVDPLLGRLLENEGDKNR